MKLVCLIGRSFGVLMWEIFSLGYAPYPGRSNEQVMELVASGGRLEQPQGCPFPVYVIMTSCWNPCPASRPLFAQIIAQLRRCQQVWYT